MTTISPASVRAAVAAVVDPEIRVVTIEELGILRSVAVADDGRTVVTITPTYSGCPAMDVIRADVAAAARASGAVDVEVRTVLSPPWSTDDINETGRRKLAKAGIAPPVASIGAPVLMQIGRGPSAGPRCPRCGSVDTTELSRFGSTACKALWRCRACREPFDHIKGF